MEAQSIYDWLEIETPEEKRARREKAKHKTRAVSALDQSRKLIGAQGRKNPRRAELATLRRMLDLRQRDYLDAMVTTRFHKGNARKIYRNLGYDDKSYVLTRWSQLPEFQRALEIYHDWLTQTLGAKVLLQVDALAEYGMDDVEVRDRSGVVIPGPDGKPLTAMRDPLLALKANELLGKHHNMWGDDDKGARVTVELINLTGEAEGKPTAIDGEFTDITDA